MDQLPEDVWNIILADLDIKSIVVFVETLQNSKQHSLFHRWLSTRTFPIKIDDDSYNHEIVPKQVVYNSQFKRIAPLLNWDIDIKLDENSPDLSNYRDHINTISCTTKDLHLIKDELFDKVRKLNMSSVRQSHLLKLSDFVNLQDLSMETEFIVLDLQELSKLKSLEIRRGQVTLRSLPLSLTKLVILGTLAESTIDSKLNLVEVTINEFVTQEGLESLQQEGLDKLLSNCKQSLRKLCVKSEEFYLNRDLGADLQQVEFWKELLLDHAIPEVKMYGDFANEINPRIEHLTVEEFLWDHRKPIKFNGTYLKVDKFERGIHNGETAFDSSVLGIPNVQYFETNTKFTQFPNFNPNVIHTIKIKGMLSDVPTLDQFTNLKVLDLFCDSRQLIINPPNLTKLTLLGKNITKIIVNDNIKELILDCLKVSNINDITCFKSRKFPRLLTKLEIQVYQFTEIHEFDFPKSLQRLRIFGTEKLKSIRNVTFESGSQLREFQLKSNAKYDKLVLPPHCQTIKLFTFDTIFNFKEFKFPEFTQQIQLAYMAPWGPMSNIPFQGLKSLRYLSLMNVRLLTTENTPLCLPNSLEYFFLTYCVTNSIDLKFEPGVTKLKFASLLFNVTNDYDMDPAMFPTFTYKSIGQTDGTYHDNLETIVCNNPPGNYDMEEYALWNSPFGTSSALPDEIKNQVFRGSPKNLRLVKIIGRDGPILCINPKFLN